MEGVLWKSERPDAGEFPRNKTDHSAVRILMADGLLVLEAGCISCRGATDHPAVSAIISLDPALNVADVCESAHDPCANLMAYYSEARYYE